MEAAKDKRIPAALRQEAKCFIVFPSVLTAGLVVAVKGGQGIGSCRRAETGEWGVPAYFNMGAASVGLQAGIQSASIILVIRDPKSVDEMLKGRLSFGGGLSLAAGPVGGTSSLPTVCYRVCVMWSKEYKT